MAGETPTYRCPICGRIQNPGKARRPPLRMCADARCPGWKQQTIAGDRVQQRRPSAHQNDGPLVRRATLHGDGHDMSMNAIQSHLHMLAVMEEKAIEDTFWSCYVPVSGLDLDDIQIPDFLESQAPYQQLRDIAYNSPLVERCARACAFACLGRLHSDRRLNMRGAQMYSGVLRQASALMSHPATTNVDDLLACCLDMCNYEALRDDTEPGEWYFPRWYNHVKGICQVLRARAQSGQSSFSIRYAWHEARLKAARSAMFLRQPVFTLERPPELLSGADDINLYDDMLDYVFAILQWVPQIDRLTQRMDEAQRRLVGLTAVNSAVKRGISIADDLASWEKRAVKRYCDSEEDSLSSLCTRENGELLNLLTHYWMGCMLLYSQLRLFVARFSLWYPQVELPPWIDPWPHAVSIQRAGPLACDPAHGIWSAQQAITPMIAAVFYFAGSGNWHTPEAGSLRNYVEDGHRAGNASIRRWFRGMFAEFHLRFPDSDIIPQAQMVAVAQKWYGIRDNAHSNEEPK